MHSAGLILALVASVSAHGKIAVATGDAGGNTTALGIQGGVIPGAGPNSKTEKDTTIFKKTDIATDGLGKTEGQGENTVDMMDQVTAMSGSTVPQVSASGGTVSGTMHIVTTDGAGPFKAMIDSGATGAFSSGQEADVTTQVPGKGGNIAPGPLSNNLLRRAMWHLGLSKRALNVDSDYPFAVQVPAGTTCTGTMGSMTGVCMMKVANANPAGPFGGVIAFQMAGAASNSSTAAAAAAPAATGSASTASSENSSSADEDEDEEETSTKKAGKLVGRSAKFVQF